MGAYEYGEGLQRYDLDDDRVFISGDRRIRVTVWPNGTLEVELRANPKGKWGAPVALEEERPATNYASSMRGEDAPPSGGGAL